MQERAQTANICHRLDLPPRIDEVARSLDAEHRCHQVGRFGVDLRLAHRVVGGGGSRHEGSSFAPLTPPTRFKKKPGRVDPNVYNAKLLYFGFNYNGIFGTRPQFGNCNDIMPHGAQRTNNGEIAALIRQEPHTLSSRAFLGRDEKGFFMGDRIGRVSYGGLNVAAGYVGKHRGVPTRWRRR